MANPIWNNGAGTRALSTAGNWNTGAAPTTGDNAFFIADFKDVGAPNSSMTGLTDTMATVSVGDGYTAEIGGAGNHAVLETSGKIVHKGTGTFWLKAGIAGIAELVLDVTGGANLPSGKHLSLGTTNTVALAFIKRGAMVHESGGVVTRYKMGSPDVPANDGRLTIDAGGTVSTDLMQWGGNVDANANVPTLHLHAGTYNQLAGLISTAGHIWGGQCNLKVAGTYPRLDVYDGILDCLQGGGVKIITDLYVYTRRAMEQIRGLNTPMVQLTNAIHCMW